MTERHAPSSDPPGVPLVHAAAEPAADARPQVEGDSPGQVEDDHRAAPVPGGSATAAADHLLGTRPPDRPGDGPGGAENPAGTEAPGGVEALARAEGPTGAASGDGPAGVESPAGVEAPAHADSPGGAESSAGDAQPDGGQAGAAAVWPDDDLLDAVELEGRGLARRDLEAVLLVADEPVALLDLAASIGQPRALVEELLVELAGEYARDGRGFVLRAVAGGWRLYTHPGAHDAVETYVRAGQHGRLTRAALETIAVVAYRQPVTRLQVAAVRGVNVDGVFRTLLSRGLIRELGHDEGLGHATLYGTTPAFLEQLGLDSLDQLPPLKDYLPEGVDLADLQEQPGEQQ